MGPKDDVAGRQGAPPASSEVVSLRELSPGVFVLRFTRDFDFLPGQHIGLSVAPDLPPRRYSVASGVGEDCVEVLFDVVAEGALTPRLAAARPGDPLLVYPPTGAFVDDDATAVWIATGTGVAPFRSMVRSGLGSGKILIQGARRADEFHFAAEFVDAGLERYVRCASRDAGPGLYPGRLSAWLREEPTLPVDRRYLLCGGALMVVEVRDLLIGRGIPFTGIVSETYF